MKICHGTRGLQGIHTFFIIDVLSTKTAILVDNWLLASSWLVISLIISSYFCFQSKLFPAEASAIGPWNDPEALLLCMTSLTVALVVGLASIIGSN
jgi:hypothetical protein